MSGRDFARSLVSGVQSSMIDTYLNRIAALPDNLADVQVNGLIQPEAQHCLSSLPCTYMHAAWISL